ncbi:membrane protein, putative [Babesia ovata]|uniref:Membrane protein, putative n=1 Tax=Babesia ovata TaxID=189622 RepID=A0A2H6KCQ9_9APIC|nr:uncharacterized protein BOVATA_022710 [Babesia ovata]GBE60778.1 membrane protein, putative [Babesia ovata]
MLAASVALVALHTVVKSAAAEKWSVRDMFSNAVERVTSYAIVAKTIEYVNEEDFDPAGEMMQTVELVPGQSLKYSCGKHGTAAKGTFTLVPSDPSTHVLAPKGDDPVEVAMNRLQPNHNVYRSDRSLVVKTFQKIGLDHLLIDYADNTVIMAKDNERFSMNLLCIFVPADVDGVPKYRWLQIKFKDVLPMAYGCGSGGFNLFKNAIPLPVNPSAENITEASRCRIEAEPGMIVGIYCAPDDHIYPSDCFRKVTLNDGRTEIPNYFSDPDFKYQNLKGNIRLMKIKPGAIGGHPTFTCFCKNAKNQTTGVVTVSLSKRETCDFTKLLEFYGARRIMPRFLCYKRIGRGKSVSLVVAKSDGTIDRNRLVGGLTIFPKDVTNSTYLTMKSVERMKKIRIDQLIGSVGVRITQSENRDNYIYNFDATDDAIIVLKQPVANLTYIYEYYDRFHNTPKTYTTLVSLQIVPTDPYTHGCGVGYPGLFNSEGVIHDNKYIKVGRSYQTQVNCTVNGWSTSPVGFYCPKDHILEPADCFTTGFLMSSDRTAKMADYAPLARVINAPNLRVIDFSVPNAAKSKITYSDEALQCRCKRKDGTVVATITVTLKNPQQH